MDIRQRSMPLFGEVVQRTPNLQKSKEFMFFAPHTSEHPAVLPLISELSERMRQSGIKNESGTIDDMRENVIAISAKLSRIWRAGKERDTLERLFKLKDALVRLDVVANMLASRPKAALLEMHALDRDYDDMDRFDWGEHFYRIPDSRALYAKDYFSEYKTQIKQGLEAMVDGRGKAATALKEILELHINRLVEEVPGKLEILEKNARRTLLMEIPAPATVLLDNPSPMTAFESTYGYKTSLKHTLAEQDIDSVLSAIVRP